MTKTLINETLRRAMKQDELEEKLLSSTAFLEATK